MYILIGWYFFFPLSLTRLSVFLCCRIQLPQQSCFLLHKTSVEYTRLYSSIAEVLLYTVEPCLPCNDVFSKCWIVDLYGRTPYTLQWRFSKCWIVESNPVGAWVLLKLYISSSPILAIHCSLWTNHSLSLHKICIYHHHPCSTQQLFYEVEIICFSLIFMTQQTVMM